MEQIEKDLGELVLWMALPKMETTQAQELLTKLEENLAGISEENRGRKWSEREPEQEQWDSVWNFNGWQVQEMGG